MNLTDVDDKTIAGAEREGVPLREYTDRYIRAFFDDLDQLRIERAEHYPRATDHIDEMIGLIRRLEERGLAYRSGESVYFRIGDFPGYGRLSGIDLERDQARGAGRGRRLRQGSVTRLRALEGGRQEPVGWDSPWGRGRPGWHIECSAMSMKYLGETLRHPLRRRST